MSTLVTSFRNMTFRDTINSLAGLLRALRRGDLQGMSNQQRTSNIRQLQFGIGLLVLAGYERSFGTATSAVSNITGPAFALTEAGKKTQLLTGKNWGMIMAGQLAAACLLAFMQFSGPSQTGHHTTLQLSKVEQRMSGEEVTSHKLPQYRL